jgi:RNA polymerase sigma factor (sigma-70 family)
MVEIDAQDVAELFGEHGVALARAARRLVSSEADAEDAVQDAMVAVLGAPHLLAVVENVGGWLYTLVRRRCVDILRRQDVRSRDDQEAALTALLDDVPDAQELVDRQELVIAVADAVNHLEDPVRFAFVESVLEGRTFKDVSAQTGTPMGTLMARKQRAVHAIRNELRGRGFISRNEDDEKERES